MTLKTTAVQEMERNSLHTVEKTTDTQEIFERFLVRAFFDFFASESCYFLVNILVNHYRRQRSWGKVIFSEACVNNSVHRGGHA